MLLAVRWEREARGQISEDSNVHSQSPLHMAAAGTVGLRRFIQTDAINTSIQFDMITDPPAGSVCN